MSTLPYQSRCDAVAERQQWTTNLGVVAAIVAQHIGGRCELDAETNRYKVHVAVGRWAVSIEHVAWFTRAQLIYTGLPGLYLLARRTTALDWLGERVGRFDTEVGDGPFDAAYWLRGADPARLRAAFDDASVRAALMLEWSGSLEVGGNGTTRHVRFDMPGRVTDIGRLRAAVNVVALMAERLLTVGEARAE